MDNKHTSRASLSILLLDDDEFTLELTSDMLVEMGVTEVITASNGKSGIALFDQLEQKPDLVICDIFMPEMDGIEFLNRVAERGYAGGVILFSGNNAKTTMLTLTNKLSAAKGLRNLGTLEKPVDYEQLRQLIFSY